MFPDLRDYGNAALESVSIGDARFSARFSSDFKTVHYLWVAKKSAARYNTYVGAIADFLFDNWIAAI